MKKNMKNKLLFALFILVATALFNFFIYELLNSLDFEHLVIMKSQNNLLLNNQVSARYVNNITFTTTADKAFPSLNHGINDPRAIAVITLAGCCVVALATGSVFSLLQVFKVTGSKTENIEMEII